MIPIIWRLLVSQYLKVTFFCIIAFIAVLLTTRLDEIAHFASLDASFGIVLLFVTYQIPFILPIALPIACLISSILLVQRLSRTHELTAFRACGISLREIMTPLLLTAAALSILNFVVVSEMATHSHLATSLLKTELRSINPLFLMSNKHLMRLKGAYFEALGSTKMGESASDVFIAVPGKKSNRLNLLTAKEFRSHDQLFEADKVSLITPLPSEQSSLKERIAIENINTMRTSSDEFSQFLTRKVLKINNDQLRLSMLLGKLSMEKTNLRKAHEAFADKQQIKNIRKEINRCYAEILRRLSVALAVFTFTFMGLSFGISIGRLHSNKSVFIVISLAAFYLIAYFTAKGLEQSLTASGIIYLAPHAILILLSLRAMQKVSGGKE